MRPSPCLAVLTVLAACAARSAGPASGAGIETALVVKGGAIHTLDPARPRAEIVVARGGKITCVGAKAADCAEPAGARVLDLRGGSAIPGLADAHGHVAGLGFALVSVNLGGARNEAECVERIAARAKTVEKGKWIHARGWDQTRWAGQQFPTEAALSRAVPDHPVFATRVDGHAAWVNQKALALAGLGKDTPDPAGGRIVRGEGGRPSGVLIDNAVELVASRIPEASSAELEEAVLSAGKALVALGLTSVHDAGVGPRQLELYRRLATQGKLPLRIYAMIDGSLPRAELLAQLTLWKKTPVVAELLGVRAVKLYADGAMGSRGALMYEPYADEPGNRGLAVTPHDELAGRIALVASAGFQPAVHAIGDRATAEVLADYVSLGKPELRPRVEHLQVLQPKDAGLLKQAHAVASMQPTHATSDGPWVEARLGHGTPRQKGAYAWRQALDQGAVLACGSDFPVESPDPRAGLESAETRQWGKNEPPGGFMPEQRLTRAEAVRCFTQGAAFAEHAEGRRGTLQEGFDADLTAFGGDVMAVPAAELHELAVLYTVVGGRVEYAR